MTKYLIIIFLLIPVLCFADISKREHHDIHHVTGSCILTAYLNHMGDMSWMQSACTVFVLGLLWECLDGAFYALKIKTPVFDHYKGFDKMDLVRNGIGVSLSFPIRHK